MIWPFGRKKKKKSTIDEDQAMAATSNNPPERARIDPGQEVSEMMGRRPSRKDSSRRHRSSSRKLTKRNRESEQADPIPDVPPIPPRSAKRNALNEKVNVPGAEPRAERDLEKPPNERHDVPSYYFQNPMSMSSLQPEKFSAISIPPTLRAKRSANDTNMSRRKSSKRKADDHAREQEIKSMSSPIPIAKRPLGNTGGMLARDSKAVPGGLNRNLERPVSDVSIPLPESVHSAMSVASDQHGFKVSAFDALSPRPTIRYSGNPRQNNGSGSLRPSRTSTRKEKQPMIPEETVKSKKRIDELADDLDAGNLRELMERDRRRQEKSRKSEQEKLHRRLQRKAEKQRAEAGAEAKVEEPDFGLGIAGPSTRQPETSREQETKTPESWLHDPSREHLPMDPFTDPVVGGSTTHLEEPTPTDEPEEPVLETAKAVRLSSASMSPPASPSLPLQAPPNMSQLADIARRSTPSIPELAESERRDSDTSTRLATNWANIFRRSGTRAKRSSADRGRTPSEFSNTSRDSLPRQMPPSAFPARIPQARSGTPMRTQSRFREDLPELPISPPESRVQSPVLPRDMNSPIPGQLGAASSGIPASPDQPLSDIHPAFREEVALSRHQSVRSAHSPEGPSSAVLSQSLASVDSEGSWLTGRPVKRLSQPQVNPTRDSGGSLQKHLENLRGMPDDTGLVSEQEPLNHVTPALETTLERERERTAKPRHILGAGLDDESDDESALHSRSTPLPQEEGTWHSAVGRHPTIVRQGARARSREGLLNDFQAAEDSTEASPTSPEEESPTGQVSSPEMTFIQRATSVELGKGHARHISAGSARLLNLPPRSSTELKRLSGSSGERSPLASPRPSPRLETYPSDVDD